jgi:hypothetical protein
MKSRTQIKLMVVAVASAFGVPVHAADGAVFSGEVTPKLYSFDYYKGSGTNATQFLERYNYQQGMGGDQRSGSYIDLDLSLVGNNGKRDFFVLEREGFGAHNHRGKLKANSDTLGFTGYYTNFRSATGGLGFLYNPNLVPGGTDGTYGTSGSAFIARFNNDAPGQTLFKVDRATYGLGLALKPTLFGSTMAAALNYDGYKRDGNRFASWIAGGSDIFGAGSAVNDLQRWRGFDMPVNEKLNRYTISLNASPGGFNIGYEGTVEKFDNQARNFTMGDFAPNIPGNTLAASGNGTKSVHFVPDSTLISNNLRFAKNYGATSVAAGYGLSVLDQDSFTQRQQTAGFKGKITTNSAYLNVTSHVLADVGLEGFVKYNNRDNDSTFPAVGLLNPNGDQQLGVHIRRIKALNFGLAGTFRLAPMKSTVTVGWKRDDKDRDLTYSSAFPTAPGGSIQPQRSLYREKTVSDELYVNWIARPAPGYILRVTPSYVWANETGQVTEPEKAFNLKTKLSYAAANGILVSGYFNHKDSKNANNSMFNSIANGVPTTSITQDADKTQEAAGISLNLPVSEWINTHASLSWMQDNFASYYFSSDTRRFEQGVVGGSLDAGILNFLARDRSNYKINTYVLTLGGDWQVSDELRWNGGYTWSRSKGNTASGLLLSELPTVDGTISNAVHSLNLGVDFEIKKNVKLKASYVYDYNKDDSYSALTGGYHTLMMGVGFGF